MTNSWRRDDDASMPPPVEKGFGQPMFKSTPVATSATTAAALDAHAPSAAPSHAREVVRRAPPSYNGRVVFGGHMIRDECGLVAQFPEQGSGASFVIASKLLDVVALLPGNCGEQSDAPSLWRLP